jgi:hypothetical protein
MTGHKEQRLDRFACLFLSLFVSCSSGGEMSQTGRDDNNQEGGAPNVAAPGGTKPKVPVPPKDCRFGPSLTGDAALTTTGIRSPYNISTLVIHP